jgi:hypothetical protein
MTATVKKRHAPEKMGPSLGTGPLLTPAAPTAVLSLALRCEPPAREWAKIRTCRECGERFSSKRASGEFCSPLCRRNFGNRRLLRGAAFYDLVMAIRFDRDAAEADGAWSLLCRMAAAFRAEDDAERAGRKSWDSTAKVRARNLSIIAKLVGVNVAGKMQRHG